VPLTGLRVVDLTRVLSGPFCSLLLADMGADVIKVETPGEGDPVRHQGVVKDGLSWYFAAYNRNKRSIALNLRSAGGREVLERLIAESDVVVDNFRPGVLDKMGFGRDRVQALKPDIISCSINGFGASGPYRDRPAFDFIAQAMSGFMSVTGGPGDPPLRAGIPISDLAAGLYGALAVVAAVVRRQRTGKGEAINVSLMESLVSLLSFQAANFLASGELPPRTGNDHPIVAPYGLFRTADGEVAIAPSTEAHFLKLLDAVGAPELRALPDFRTNALRVQHRAAINAAIEAKTAAKPSAFWIETLNAAGVPCGPVLGLGDVFNDPQAIDQQMTITVEHPGHGTVRTLGFPIKFADQPCRVRAPAPDLGANSAEILAELGLTGAETERLRQAGAFSPASTPD
jgi:crotonobetainyl-CoA:carnitine CoA-transferase CaiB-like acyl-CoA transferase